MVTVSIIVTYRKNKKQYLGECLDKIMHQTILPQEVVLVEDCLESESSGKFEDIYEEVNKLSFTIPLKVFQFNERKGKAYQINFGIKKSSGDYIGICSSDDFYESTFIEESLKALEKGDISWGTYNIVDETGKLLYHYSVKQMDYDVFLMEAIKWAKTHGMFCCMATWFARKELFLKSPFDDYLKLTEDLEWFLRTLLVDKYKYVFIDKTLTNYRISPSQAGSTLKIEILEHNNEYSRQKINKLLREKIF